MEELATISATKTRDDDEVCEDDVCCAGAEFKADVLLTKEFLGMIP